MIRNAPGRWREFNQVLKNYIRSMFTRSVWAKGCVVKRFPVAEYMALASAAPIGVGRVHPNLLDQFRSQQRSIQFHVVLRCF